MTQMIFLVEFSAVIDPAGTTESFRYSSASDFMTRPSESPPNTPYPAFVDSPGQYESDCWQQGATRGTSNRGFGVIKFANGDGRFDIFMDYGLDGQPIQVLFGPDNGAYPEDFIVLFTGIIRRGQYPSRSEFDLVLVDRQGDAADYTFQLQKFAGTNSGASGLEGLPTDIQGKPKPNLFGRCFNVPAIPVNTSSLVYQVDDGTAILVAGGAFLDAVYDRRSPLAPGTHRTTLAALISNTPGLSDYDWYSGPEGWFFKLGSPPIGIITCDCHEGAASDRTCGQIASRIASRQGGLPISQMDGIAALDAAKPYECGIWVGAESTVGQEIDRVLDSANAFMCDTRDGRILFGYLQDPDQMEPVTAIYDWMVKNETDGYTVTGTNDNGIGLRLSSNYDGSAQRYASNQDTTLGLPAWRILALYSENNQVMSATDVAGDALDDIWYVKNQYRTYAGAEDPNILLLHKKAPEFTVTTCICSLADITIEAQSQILLRGKSRTVRVIPLDPGQVDQFGNPVTAAIDRGKSFTMYSDRYGMQNGKKLFCIGIAEDFGDPTTPAISTIYAWG